jgi:hypothetical protein
MKQIPCALNSLGYHYALKWINFFGNRAPVNYRNHVDDQDNVEVSVLYCQFECITDSEYDCVIRVWNDDPKATVHESILIGCKITIDDNNGEDNGYRAAVQFDSLVVDVETCFREERQAPRM